MYNSIDIIFNFIREYSTKVYSLPRVTKLVIEYMKSGGYDAVVVDNTHKNYKDISVDGIRYRIVRNNDWLRYDVMTLS